jgi:hypothetical protein
MRRFFIFVVIISAYISEVHSAMTNSGQQSLKDSCMWIDINNTSTGIIIAERAKFLKLTNYGTVQLDNCIMTKEVESFGIFNIKETTFMKDVFLGGGEATLTSCQLENLFILMNQHDQHPPRVVLNGTTIIHGSVIFKGDAGFVYKGPDAVIQGEITNGMVIDLEN